MARLSANLLFAVALAGVMPLITSLPILAKEVPTRAPVATQPEEPPKLDKLQEIEEEDAAPLQGLQLRQQALHDAALSYGARGGLARHTWEILQQLKMHESELNRTFDFSKLLIPVSSGLVMEPPIVSEADDASVVASKGQAAAVADRVYRINQNARLVTAARDWHAYLERDWGEVTPPPATLTPQDDDERDQWEKWVAEGWEAGYQQADDIFSADLDRLVHDFNGMVRYRKLLAEGAITSPYALSTDRGITGGGDEMRVGDRAVTITGFSQLNPQGKRWTPTDH